MMLFRHLHNHIPLIHSLVVQAHYNELHVLDILAHYATLVLLENDTIRYCGHVQRHLPLSLDACFQTNNLLLTLAYLSSPMAIA